MAVRRDGGECLALIMKWRGGEQQPDSLARERQVVIRELGRRKKR